MCTLIIASRLWDDTPLLVAANRDERLDRPARVPEIEDDGPIPVLAPRDLQAGGTWLGLNARGLFVGITNRFGAERDPDKRSRGLVVREALAQPDAARAAEIVAEMEATAFSPFHLLIADRQRLYRVWSDGAEMHADALEPGWHFLTERSLGAAETRREPALREALDAFTGERPPSDEALRALLSTHAEPSFEGLCVHWPELNYGTRSSTILRLGAKRGDVRFLHASGAPCQTELEDLSASARELELGG